MITIDMPITDSPCSCLESIMKIDRKGKRGRKRADGRKIAAGLRAVVTSISI